MGFRLLTVISYFWAQSSISTAAASPLDHCAGKLTCDQREPILFNQVLK
jgi:hypothetical protein